LTQIQHTTNYLKSNFLETAMKISINVDTNNGGEIEEAIQFLESMIGQTPEVNEMTPVKTLTQMASHQAHEQIMPEETHITAQDALERTHTAEDILNEVKKEEPKKDSLPQPAVIEEEF
jgi:hypothetical protein